MKLAVILAGVANIVFYFLGLWLTFSLVTSGIKSYNKDCGSHYGVERYRVDGDFFCKR